MYNMIITMQVKILLITCLICTQNSGHISLSHARGSIQNFSLHTQFLFNFWVQIWLRHIESKKKARQQVNLCVLSFTFCMAQVNYIIPPMPPPMPAGIAGASSLMSATTDSVVSIVAATDVAF